ncbi:hypothetical protein [Kribbella sp. VKM Ac-2566]|uniref:hypothetical protein n=1 Tax=Kribbella sp. VKM Ac-2566 TaxID=2512218 RepID=UPI0010E615F2|nr:hypothetical protein [Kribbella sp. VKM Ac-2566]TDW83179.1 hypothetical protein EV647_6882 [Kribbella sp. VKM Ac-2566]
MKAELRSLPRTLADLVAQHLVASGRFLDDDPELAYQHARTARRLAARLGGVREAVAITAYLAEHYDEALTEFRAVRRMTGNHEVIAMMADCERALGRPDKALALTKDKHVHDVSEATQVELLIVAAGARRDKGQTAAAVQMLEVPELTKRTRAEWLPRLRYAYADALAEAGRTDDALVWFHRAAGVDGDGVTGAAERAAELEGLEFTDLDEDDTVVDDEYFEDEDTDTTTDATAEDADIDVDTDDVDTDDVDTDDVDTDDVDIDEVDDADEDADEETGTTTDVAAEDADLDVDTDDVDTDDVDNAEVDDAGVDDAGDFGEVGREGDEGVGEMTGGESKGDGE